MFWRSPGLVQASPVELVLDKESFTLEELLEEDDVIQECKSLNSRLVHFLKTKPVVDKLVSYLVVPPPPNADARREFKYPYLACEIFCCELDAVFATLCENDCELFGRLMRFIGDPLDELDTDHAMSNTATGLNPMLASYFGKVVGCLVSRRAPETTSFFTKNPKYLHLLVSKISSLAVAEVLLRLVGADDPGGSPMQGMLLSAIHGSDQTGWLAETTLLDQLLDALGENGDGDANGGECDASEESLTRRANAAEVLVGIARGAPSALGDMLAEAGAMRKLFKQGLGDVGKDTAGTDFGQTLDKPGAFYGSRNDGGSGANDVDENCTTKGLPATAHCGLSASPLVNVIDVAIAVLDAKRSLGPAQAMQAFLAAETGEPVPEPRQAAPSAIAACAESLPLLVQFLEQHTDTSTQKTPWGEQTPPLGLKRVKVCDLIATLVCCRDVNVTSALIATGALTKLTVLFAKYPFNNFLHHHIERCIVDALEWGDLALLEHVFESVENGGCDVIGMVASADQTVDTCRGPFRSGNLGHVTRISNVILGIAGGVQVGEFERNVEDGDGDGERKEQDVNRLRNAAAFVSEKLELDSRWRAHVDGALATRNNLENVRSWQCGRPPGMDDMDEEASGDDDGASDFDLGLGAGFSRDQYNRYGASSGGMDDEENSDDDEEDPLDQNSEDDNSDDEDDSDLLAGDFAQANSLRKIAVGLFQGDADAGARLASLTLGNNGDDALLADEGVLSEDDDDQPGFGRFGHVGSSIESSDFGKAEVSTDPPFAGGASVTFAATQNEDDQVLLGSDDDADANDVFATGKQSDESANDEVGTEWGAVQFWGSGIDQSLVPDDI